MLLLSSETGVEVGLGWVGWDGVGEGVQGEGGDTQHLAPEKTFVNWHALCC